MFRLTRDFRNARIVKYLNGCSVTDGKTKLWLPRPTIPREYTFALFECCGPATIMEKVFRVYLLCGQLPLRLY
jgi:hypothetical protein